MTGFALARDIIVYRAMAKKKKYVRISPGYDRHWNKMLWILLGLVVLLIFLPVSPGWKNTIFFAGFGGMFAYSLWYRVYLPGWWHVSRADYSSVGNALVLTSLVAAFTLALPFYVLSSIVWPDRSLVPGVGSITIIMTNLILLPPVYKKLHTWVLARIGYRRNPRGRGYTRIPKNGIASKAKRH